MNRDDKELTRRYERVANALHAEAMMETNEMRRAALFMSSSSLRMQRLVVSGYDFEQFCQEMNKAQRYAIDLLCAGEN